MAFMEVNVLTHQDSVRKVFDRGDLRFQPVVGDLLHSLLHGGNHLKSGQALVDCVRTIRVKLLEPSIDNLTISKD